MQNLNTLFTLVKQAAPVESGSPDHEALVGKLNRNEITQSQFDTAMQGMPIPPVEGGSTDHEALVGRLNGGEISQDQFDTAMRGGRRLVHKVSPPPTLKRKTNGELPPWFNPLTINPYPSGDSLTENQVPGFGLFGGGKMHPGLTIGIGNYGQHPWEGTSGGGGLFGGGMRPDYTGPGLWRPNENKGDWWDPITGPFVGPSKKQDEQNPWNPLTDPFGPMKEKKNPWERNKDQNKYYDEFWKWYNKEGLWTYTPGSDPSWEDETWRRHKDKFMEYYNQQPKPVTPGSPEHQQLVERLNKQEITKDQFDELMNGKQPQAAPKPVTPGSQPHQDLVGRLNGGQITQGQFDNAMSGAAPVTLGSQQHQDLVGQLNGGQITQGQFDNHFQGAPVTPGSPQHQDLVGRLNGGQLSQGQFDNAMNGVSALSKPQPAAPQPSTPSVGSAIGKPTYNPAAITRKDMNKYRKYTSARNMNSDMDRWKTWQAMNGNRNASNADYHAAKRNNFM